MHLQMGNLRVDALARTLTPQQAGRTGLAPFRCSAVARRTMLDAGPYVPLNQTRSFLAELSLTLQELRERVVLDAIHVAQDRP